MRSLIKYALLLFVSLLALGAMMGRNVDVNRNREVKDQQKTDYTKHYQIAEKTVRGMIDEGIVRKIDLPTKSVYVSPLAWSIADIEQKEILAMNLAYYCGNHKDDGMHRATIYDHQSGKELAEWSEAWGFSVE